MGLKFDKILGALREDDATLGSVTAASVSYSNGASGLTATDVQAAIDELAGAAVTDGDKGDIVVSSSGTVWSIDALVIQTGMIAHQAVTLGKMAHIATNRFLGRTTAGTGDVESLTTTQATAMLNAFTTSLQGVVPASGGGTTNYLRADGTWAAIATQATNLSIANRGVSTLDVASDTGNDATVPAATTSLTGLMTAADKTKLDGVTAGASVSGSGTLNYSARWTGATSLGDGVIRDNGTTASINSGLDSNYTLIVGSSVQPYGIFGTITTIGGGTQVGVAGSSSGAGTGENAGVLGTASGNTVLNAGVKGNSTGATAKNIGGYFTASGGTANYALRLEDGTQGVGKFLKSISANGEANWATISTSDISGYAGLSDGDKGDITVSSSGTVWTIDTASVTLAKMADMATASLIYRKTAGTGVPEVQTLATLKTDLGLTGTNSGDQTITLTSDVTGSGTGSFATTIANNAVTNAKAADMAVNTIKGRITAGTGDPEDLTATQVRTILNITDGAKPKPSLTKCFTLDAPTAADDITIFRTDVAITVVEVIAVSTGTTPSTTYQLMHGTDRDAAGTAVTTSAATTSKTTGNTATLSDATIPADSWIWFESTAASGTTVKLTVDIRYTED